MEKTSKHANLIKPKGGSYHNNEWALLGAPDDIIDKFAIYLVKIISNSATIGYLDASHNEEEKEEYKKSFSHLDILLVNGNHFHADKQIVFINEEKKDSLEKELNRITDLRILIVEEDLLEIYKFIMPIITRNTQIFNLVDVGRIADVILEDHPGAL